VPQVFKFFSYCWSKLWLLGAVLLIIVALSVSALRASLPYITQYNQQLSQYLSDNYQIDLGLNRITGQWKNGGPAIIIDELRFDNMARFGINFNAEKIKLHLNFRQSLIDLSPRFELISVTNSKLTVGQLPQGEATGSDPIPYLFELATTVLFEQATIEFEPSVYGHVPSVQLKRLQWLNSANRHQLQLSLTPLNSDEAESASSLEPLSLVADIFGKNRSNVHGQFYLKANQWQWLDNFRPLLSAINPTATAKASFELWGEFSANELSSAQLVMAANDLTWQYQEQPQQLSLRDTILRWQPQKQGWQLDSERLLVSTNAGDWPEINLQLISKKDPVNTEHSNHKADDSERDTGAYTDSLALSVDQLLLENLLALRGLLSTLPVETERLLTELAPQATLSDLKLWQQDNQWHYQATVSDYQQQRSGLLPKINQLDVLVLGNEHQGKAEIALSEQALDFGKSFAEPIKLKRLNSTVQWAVDGNRWWLFDDNLVIETTDIKSQLSWQLAFETDQSPILSLSGAAELFAAENTWRYLPHGALSRGLINYLNAGIKSGRSDDVKILWQGALGGYPYRDHSGLFEIDATLNKAKFVYDAKWPPLSDAKLRLLFKNEGLLITGLEGRVKQLKFSQLSAQIPDLTQQPTLAVKLTLTDKIEPINRVIKASPLKSTVGVALNQLGIGGKVTADIDLTIPFDGTKPVTKGQIRLSNNSVHLKAIDLSLTRVSGLLHFVDGRLSAKKLTAVMYQQPFKFDILAKPIGGDYQVAIDLAAKWNTEKMPQQWHGYLDDYLAGSLNWQGKVKLNLSPKDISYQVNINSPMTGMLVKLPQPLSKYVDQQQPLTVKVFGDTDGGQFKLALGRQAGVLAQFDLAPTGLAVTSMALRVGQSEQDSNNGLVANELGLTVNLAHLDVDQWHTFITNLQQDQQDQQGSKFLPPLSHINIKVKALSVMGQTLADVSLQGIKRQGFWQIALNSEQAKGQLKVFDDLATDGIVANFDYLTLSENNGSGMAAKEKTKAQLLALPMLTFTCQRCRIGDYNLGKVSFKTGRNEQGITIDNLVLAAVSTKIKLNGTWGVDDQGEFSTVTGNLTSDNVADTLKLFNFGSSIKDSDAKVDFALDWRGNIYNPLLESMAGTVNWHLGEGHISEVSDKGARIFSLFSLDSLRRKLVLDFRDVFVKGLFFNRFDGSFKIKDGVAVTHDTHMDGIAGDLDVLGSINLASKNLDYYLTFSPRLFSNLPVVAGVVASAPQVFIVAFALTKVLEPIVDVVSQVNFKLSGTINEPEFVEVNRKQKKYKVPSHMLTKSKALPKPKGLTLINPGDSE